MTEFFDIAVTPSVLALQERKGSLGMYTDAVGAGPSESHVITQSEAKLLLTRDSFYLATVGETGWPYVQHRGGDAGFIKIVDEHTIGWAERNGNRQYLGTGNIAANGRVAAIFVDYPSRTRLKIYGEATHHDEPSSELLEELGATDLRNDGAITIKLLATDWNCPKYITPRFTEAHVAGAIEQLQDRIAELEGELSIAREEAGPPS
ncbi:MAG: putative pyridoxine 5'-phosphate oxidase superfamily flavin-nucleotide-binding protein [Verrucomicrobiales bacterium]|jgi:predicted pyridoxine 5'-phosphate oxidase superfamily flavin-nucleotide-binding protein